MYRVGPIYSSASSPPPPLGIALSATLNLPTGPQHRPHSRRRPRALPNETRHPKLIPVTGATGTIRNLTVSVKRALFPGEAKSIKKNISSADYFNAHIWNLSHAKASFVSSDFLLPQGSPLLRKTMRSAPAGGSFLGLHPDDSRKSRAPPAPNGQGPASFSPPGATSTAAFGARQV